MHAFLPAEDITLTSNRFTRRYLGGVASGSIQVDRLIVDTGGESELVRKAINEQRERASAATASPLAETGAIAIVDAPPPAVGLVSEAQLLAWPALPPRLGRVSTRFIGDGLHQHQEPAPLIAQLQALKARHPGKRHFRLAVVHAFGTNLGDCVLGMTAMRAVVPLLTEHLGSVVIDMYLGPQSSPGNLEIVGYEPWIGQVRLTGLTVQEFANYEGYFDFTGLISLPRFNEMPIVDWCLWWSGMDPASIPADDKRNRLAIPWRAIDRIQQEFAPALLAQKNAFPGSRLIYFNPKASVPLRSMPETVIPAFLQALLPSDEQLILVTLTAPHYRHPRLIDWSDKTLSTSEFNALLTVVDGILTVDSYPVHAADALSKPAVAIFASLPDLHPYYPLGAVTLLPGAETLPGWMKSKNANAEEWTAWADVYEQAWRQLDAVALWKQLQERLERRQLEAAAYRPRIEYVDGPHRPRLSAATPQGRRLRFETTQPMWERAVVRQTEMARALVKSGGVAVVVAPGQSQFAVALAEHLGAEGRIHCYEPRPYRRTLIAMDLLERAPQTPVQWYDTLPATARQVAIAMEEPLGETTPLLWGRSRVQRQIQALPIDALELPVLSVAFLFAPMNFRAALQSARATLDRTKANVVCAPIQSLEDVRGIAGELIPLGYQCWVDYIEGRPDGAMLLIAVPQTITLQAVGMKRVQLG